MRKIYRFAGSTLDSATRELVHGTQRQLLPPRMFECLSWLIEHRDRAVGRDELLAAVWGQVDADANVLVQVIARLRRLIDADGADSAIRTVPRFGYRWVLPTQIDSSEAADAVAPAAPVPPPRANWLYLRWALLLVLALLFAVQQPPRPAPSAQAYSLRALVLPARIDASADHAWLRLGLMALAIERLRTAGQAVVPADNVVALTRGLDLVSGAAAIDANIAEAWPHSGVVQLSAQQREGHWRVQAALLREGAASLHSEASHADVLEAARNATDGLARLLGHIPPTADTATGDGLLQVEAAALAGHSDEAFALLDRVDEAGRQNPEYRYQRAWSTFLAGQLDQAATEFQGLLAQLSAADAPVLRARALNGLANVYYQRGDFAAQRAAADEAIALLQAEDAPVELGRALMGRAVAQVRQNAIDAARRDFQLARVALESGGDRLGMARADLALGVVYKRQGRFGEARALFQGALLNLGALRDVHDELLACVHLLETHLQLLEPADALALEPRLRNLIERAPDSAARSLAQLTRLEVLQANGRLGEVRAGLALLCPVQAAQGCAQHPWRLQLAALRVQLEGNAPVALQELADSLQPASADASARKPGGRDQGRAWLLLLRERLTRDAADAERVLARMQAWADADPAPETPVYATLARAELAAARGNATAARSAFERALATADANQTPSDLLAIAQPYVAWLLAQGNAAEAGVVAGRVAAWARADFAAALVQLRVQAALGRPAAWQAALLQAQALAGERAIPAELSRPPQRAAAAADLPTPSHTPAR
ncbi:winged helix-turn-helix domain-containing protein [Tahibacter aquaticus]|nr:winged helix-turn-helix domain-containing protein [Tahibacter aquaticus]